MTRPMKLSDVKILE